MKIHTITNANVLACIAAQGDGITLDELRMRVRCYWRWTHLARLLNRVNHLEKRGLIFDDNGRFRPSANKPQLPGVVS